MFDLIDQQKLELVETGQFLCQTQLALPRRVFRLSLTNLPTETKSQSTAKPTMCLRPLLAQSQARWRLGDLVGGYKSATATIALDNVVQGDNSIEFSRSSYTPRIELVTPCGGETTPVYTPPENSEDDGCSWGASGFPFPISCGDDNYMPGSTYSIGKVNGNGVSFNGIYDETVFDTDGDVTIEYSVDGRIAGKVSFLSLFSFLH